MAKNNKINMPSSTAGITNYYNEYKSNFEFSPGHVIVLCIIVMIIVIALHKFGGALLG